MIQIKFVTEPGPEKHSLRVTQFPFRIGRDRSNDLVLKDLSISRKHAELQLTDHGIYLVALNPQNPLVFNLEQFTQIKIHSGMKVLLGKIALNFELEDISNEDTVIVAAETYSDLTQSSSLHFPPLWKKMTALGIAVLLGNMLTQSMLWIHEPNWTWSDSLILFISWNVLAAILSIVPVSILKLNSKPIHYEQIYTQIQWLTPLLPLFHLKQWLSFWFPFLAFQKSLNFIFWFLVLLIPALILIPNIKKGWWQIGGPLSKFGFALGLILLLKLMQNTERFKDTFEFNSPIFYPLFDLKLYSIKQTEYQKLLNDDFNELDKMRESESSTLSRKTAQRSK